MLIIELKNYSDLCVRSEECKVIVNLFKLTAEEKRMDELDNFTQCASSEFSFPLAADDYFMTVAILAQGLSDKVAGSSILLGSYL